MTDDDKALTCSGCGEYAGSHIADRIEALSAEVEELTGITGVLDRTLQKQHDRIEALTAEVERLRRAFMETREMLGLAEQVVHDECCPTKWKTIDGQPHCKLHEDIRDVLFRHEGCRDEASATLENKS